ncbi:MAG TPA: hypothetical protein VGK73_07195 [Polyangiaceae bacterium]
MRKISVLLGLMLCVPRPAHAEPGFAEPPGEVLVASDDPEPERAPAPERAVEGSTVRVSVGPGLRVSQAVTDGGLSAALDAGSGPIGVRAGGTWVRVGGDGGLSQYQADLWVDFGAGRTLHPIVAAGAGVARLEHEPAEDVPEASTYGIGTLRGTLEYVLPVERADARAGIDLVASIPAIHPKNAPDPGVWLLALARVGIGF